ncbi:MAG: 4-alpha-glucanotransferase [Ignavibacteria bacterium]
MAHEYFLHTKTSERWKKIGTKKRAGVTVPLFSLYSRKSVGIGEIPDLKLLVDWCKKTGMTIIQLLPLNDVGSDFAPYNSVSSFAIDPMYLSIENLSHIDVTEYTGELERMKRKYRPRFKKVNYNIKKAKLELLWRIYKSNRTDNIAEFRDFSASNNYWLNDYSMFKVISEKTGSTNWQDWDEGIKNRNDEAIEEIETGNFERINFYSWLQWQLSLQMKEVKQYAAVSGVLTMGDLPFLVSRESADVWAHQNYFLLNLSSGAPPDMYFAMGQKWGMPPYNWENIAIDKFIYLREKLLYAENFYDMFRIDHFVGLFRLWVSLAGDLNTPGGYMPKEEYMWESHGRAIIEVMAHTTAMLPCAEDLGTVPGCSYHVLYEYGIPGIDFQRYYKNNFYFRHPTEYRVNSSAVISTHDSSFWPNWWKFEAGTIDEKLFEIMCMNAGMDKKHYKYVKAVLFSKEASRYGRLMWNDNIRTPEMLKSILQIQNEKVNDIVYAYLDSYDEKGKFLTYLEYFPAELGVNPDLVYKILERINQTDSIFSIQLLQEYLFLEKDFLESGSKWNYRLNTPGSVTRDNWSLILPISLERLLELEINDSIRSLVSDTGRSL